MSELTIEILRALPPDKPIPGSYKNKALAIRRKDPAERTTDDYSFLTAYEERLESVGTYSETTTKEYTSKDVALAIQQARALEFINKGYEGLHKSVLSTVEEQGEYIGDLHKLVRSALEERTVLNGIIAKKDAEIAKLTAEAAVKEPSTIYKYLEAIAAIGLTAATAALPKALSVLGVTPPATVESAIQAIVLQTVKKDS